MKSQRFGNIYLPTVFVLVWFLGVTMPIYLGLVPSMSMTLQTTLGTLFMNTATFFISYYLITPYFIKRKQYPQLIVTLFFFGFAMIVIREVIDKFYYLGFLENGQLVSQRPGRILTVIIYLMVSMAFSAIHRLAKNENRLFSLEKSKLETELAILKSQINPHFLFNTLNNIYSLAYLKDDKTAPMIAGLSDMLRYMLYECSGTRAPLQKEIDFLKSYIDLQVIKLGDAMVVDFYVENISPDHVVAPLILINFVENAFKHTDWRVQENAWMSVNLTVTDDRMLVFEVANSKTGTLNPSEHSGIGLVNTKKQLALNYPNQHTLTINNETNSFTVLLKINLGK